MKNKKKTIYVDICPNPDNYSPSVHSSVSSSVTDYTKDKKGNWEKEAQEWMDKLSIMELQILNSIVYSKIQKAKQEVKQSLKKKVEGMKFNFNPSYRGELDEVYDNAFNQALDKVLKLLEE